MRRWILAIVVGLLAPVSAQAELTVPGFISDHMVLQRNQAAAVWGKATPGTQVKVTFKGNSASAKANQEGRWLAKVPTGAADAKGSVLSISSGEETINIQDVVVGEVWFASGQSNMVFSMNRVPAYAELIKKCDYPRIRMFNAPNVTAVEPQDDIAGQWSLCSPETVPSYSAVAFFFAQKLHDELDMPIGVIKSAWGGKPVETFTSRKALRSLAGTQRLVENAVKADAVFDPVTAKQMYETRLERWEAAVETWKQKPADQRGRRPRRPQPPKRPLNTEGQPGVLFNSMINPFVGYTIRGAIWYQGEGNAKPGAVPYDQTLPLLIRDWRTRWDDDFSFYFVQLANFRTPSTEPGNTDPWPLLQDRMRRVLDSTPKTGMAIINDVGEAKDIHPKNKHDVGKRLALWALAKDYGRDIVFCGPLLKSSSIKDGAVHVQFDHVGTGLKSRDDAPLGRFEIAGKNRSWQWADAKIISPNTVVVSSPQVKDPVAIRYAWAANPEGANLVNSDDLPASVFRTDDWDDVAPKADLEARKLLEARQALAVELKALRAKRDAAKRGSAEYQAIVDRQRELMKKYRELAPAGAR